MVAQVLRRHAGQAPAHDQTGVRRRPQLAQVGVELAQASLDELNPSIGARQRAQDVLVKDKNTMQLATGLQRQVQRRVIDHTQIAAKPHQTSFEWLGHDHR